MTNVDYIIVGQGLAGSALAIQALLKNKTILSIDQISANTSSIIAAGLFNPVTGKKMSKTWKADVLFPYLQSFYLEVEKITHSTFFHPMMVYRPFLSVGEQNEWIASSENESLSAFIEEIKMEPYRREHVVNNYGGLFLKQCGYLHTGVYVREVREYLQSIQSFAEGPFDDSILSISENEIRYGDVKARALIFCEGERLATNKFFSWLPIKPMKGETLTISAELPADVIINRGVYIVPDGRASYWRVGATYEHDVSKRCTTEKAKHELESKLKQLICVPFTIEDQQWGVRPTTPDRRPMLGAHPVHKNVLIFNGLGTKGVSLAPYFSKVLIDHLESDIPLDKEVDISRYKSLY